MSNIKKLMVSAAGGDSLDVDDVFSTYLYEGTSARQDIQNGIALGNFGRGTSTLFSGTGASSDFLNRTSDLTGNSDGKTLTLSVWVFPEEDANLNFFACATSNGEDRMLLTLDDTQKLILYLQDSSGTVLLNLESRATLGAGLPLKAWSHVLISVDLSDTSKRHLYINDAIPSHVDWEKYNNGTVDFTQPRWGVGGSPTSGTGTERMAHLYFDYTYRDLSVASNRRHFIDANGGSTSSSTKSALNPIVYMPLTEDYTTGKNLGTGGDFTINGSPTVLDTGTEYEDGYGAGGMIWGKIRSSTDQHWLVDSERGTGSNNNYKYLMSNLTNAESDFASRSVSSFNSNGFTLQNGTDKQFNELGQDYASWTFRKAPKFFDVVTWTGDGTTGRSISHNLGGTPGFIAIKALDSVSGSSGDGSWMCCARKSDGSYAVGDGTSSTSAYGFGFNKTTQSYDTTSSSNAATHITDTAFSIQYVTGSGGGTQFLGNTSGVDYVAYIFAHNDGDGDFGPDGDQDIIKCGSFTTASSVQMQSIDVGFEPQFVLLKCASSSDNWMMIDVMRGAPTVTVYTGDSARLRANLSDAESTDTVLHPTATGFDFRIDNTSSEYIYMAIRRGSLFPPESASEVFAIDASPNSSFPVYEAGFPVDLGIKRYDYPSDGNSNFACDRLRGSQRLFTNLENPESSSTDVAFDSQVGWWTQPENSTSISWMWKRAPGYFDVVAYQGTGFPGFTFNHNLGVVPEMIWIKNRGATEYWPVYHKDLNGGTNPSHYYLKLNHTNAETDYNEIWNDTEPTATQVTVGQQGVVNSGSFGHIAYLFASLDGISKVGSYTGNSGTQTIDCGFTAGARLVVVKPVSGPGNWFVWDTARGIVSGTEPYLRLNSSVAQESGYDAIDPHSSGFTLNNVGTGTNDSGTTYIFYAVA